jgi:ribonuclease Z
LEDRSFQLLAFPVTHGGSETFGFVFQEKPRRPFLVEQAEALGVPAGPERARLVQGQSITLANGRKVRPEDVLGPARPGCKFVFIGDAARTDDLVESVRDADLLVIEATYTDVELDAAREFGHLTARQAAELAVAAGVRHLVLHHISRRYSGAEILEEASRVFPRTVVARDLDHFQVRRDAPLTRVEPEAPR